MSELLLVAVAAIAVVWALTSWRVARRLARENAWIRRRLAREEGAASELDLAARAACARELRAKAVRACEWGQTIDARRYLESADEIERGGRA